MMYMRIGFAVFTAGSAMSAAAQQPQVFIVAEDGPCRCSVVDCEQWQVDETGLDERWYGIVVNDADSILGLNFGLQTTAFAEFVGIHYCHAGTMSISSDGDNVLGFEYEVGWTLHGRGSHKLFCVQVDPTGPGELRIVDHPNTRIAVIDQYEIARYVPEENRGRLSFEGWGYLPCAETVPTLSVTWTQVKEAFGER